MGGFLRGINDSKAGVQALDITRSALDWRFCSGDEMRNSLLFAGDPPPLQPCPWSRVKVPYLQCGEITSYPPGSVEVGDGRPHDEREMNEVIGSEAVVAGHVAR